MAEDPEALKIPKPEHSETPSNPKPPSIPKLGCAAFMDLGVIPSEVAQQSATWSKDSLLLCCCYSQESALCLPK
jgi:hypothetical protein